MNQSTNGQTCFGNVYEEDFEFPSMDAARFQQITGHAPERDDLERANCKQAGFIGHAQCGLCSKCGHPRFIPKFDGERLICSHRDTN